MFTRLQSLPCFTLTGFCLVTSLLIAPATGAEPQNENENGTKEKRELILTLKFDKQKYTFDEEVTGKVIFENSSMTRKVKLLFPGLGQGGGEISATSGIKLDDAGRPVPISISKGHSVFSSLQALPVKLDEVEIGADDTLEVEELLIPHADLSGTGKFVIPPGEEVEIPFTINSCRDFLPQTITLNKREITLKELTGTYQLIADYSSEGELYWEGEITSEPVKVRIVK